MPLTRADIVQGVEALLGPGNRQFIEDVHQRVTEDQHYFLFHSLSCGSEVRRILWDDASLYVATPGEAVEILVEALRLYSASQAA